MISDFVPAVVTLLGDRTHSVLHGAVSLISDMMAIRPEMKPRFAKVCVAQALLLR